MELQKAQGPSRGDSSQDSVALPYMWQVWC